MIDNRPVQTLSAEDRAPVWINSGRIPALDGLRAIAVGFVLLAHVHRTSGFPNLAPPRAVGYIGTVGVDVFFLLSGFLITTLLCREYDRTRRTSLRAFYLRRILRIVPAYVCFLLFVLALQLSGNADVSGWDWVASATYTMNFVPRPAWEVGHIWSLSI